MQTVLWRGQQHLQIQKPWLLKLKRKNSNQLSHLQRYCNIDISFGRVPRSPFDVKLIKIIFPLLLCCGKELSGNCCVNKLWPTAAPAARVMSASSSQPMPNQLHSCCKDIHSWALIHVVAARVVLFVEKYRIARMYLWSKSGSSPDTCLGSSLRIHW